MKYDVLPKLMNISFLSVKTSPKVSIRQALAEGLIQLMRRPSGRITLTNFRRLPFEMHREGKEIFVFGGNSKINILNLKEFILIEK